MGEKVKYLLSERQRFRKVTRMAFSYVVTLPKAWTRPGEVLEIVELTPDTITFRKVRSNADGEADA